MAPNQQEQQQQQQQHQQQQQKKAKLGSANLELDRLSTTGRSFLLQPESRTGIVQELQLRLQQEQRKRHELLLRSANNALLDSPQNTKQQIDKETPKTTDVTVSTDDETAQLTNAPFTADDGTTGTQARNKLSSNSQVAADNTAQKRTAQTPHRTSMDLVEDTRKLETTPELNNVKTWGTEEVRTESTLPGAPTVSKNSVTSILDASAAKKDETTVVKETASENKKSEVRLSFITFQALKAVKAKNEAATVKEESAAARKDPNAANEAVQTSSVLKVARSLRASQLASAGGQEMARAQSKRLVSDQSETTRAWTAEQEATRSHRRSVADQGADQEATRPPNGTVPQHATLISDDRADYATANNVRKSSLRSCPTAANEDGINAAQTPQRSGLQSSYDRTFAFAGESQMCRTSTSEPTANLQLTLWRADIGSRNEPTPATQSSAASSQPPSPPIAPPPLPRPTSPCLQCLMRSLLDSDLLSSCWKAAVFQLDEAFAIKEVADAAVGRSGTGTGGESIQPIPMRNLGGGVVYSGGEGSAITSPQSELSKWQALERLCNLRNSLMTCSHVTDN